MFVKTLFEWDCYKRCKNLSSLPIATLEIFNLSGCIRVSHDKILHIKWESRSWKTIIIWWHVRLDNFRSLILVGHEIRINFISWKIWKSLHEIIFSMQCILSVGMSFASHNIMRKLKINYSFHYWMSLTCHRLASCICLTWNENVFIRI